jgi:hypothetical protein
MLEALTARDPYIAARRRTQNVRRLTRLVVSALAKDATTAALIASIVHENGREVAKVIRFGELPDGHSFLTSEAKAILLWAAEKTIRRSG